MSWQRGALPGVSGALHAQGPVQCWMCWIAVSAADADRQVDDSHDVGVNGGAEVPENVHGVRSALTEVKERLSSQRKGSPRSR